MPRPRKNKLMELSQNQQVSRGVSFSTLIDPAKYVSLRLLSVQADAEIKELVDEALDLLFAKHADSIPSLPKRS